VSKFPGTYVKFDAGAAYGGIGGGLQLNVASASGVKITMK